MSALIPTTEQKRSAPQRPAALSEEPLHNSAREPTRLDRLRKAAWKFLAAFAALALIAWGATAWFAPKGNETDEITAVVVLADLPITVTERGELESSKTVDVRCDIEGYKNKIVEILAEGTPVVKDQIVVRFDTEELGRIYAEQEIKVKQAETKAKASKEDLEVQKNKAESEIATKKLELDLAELDREKYLEGDYKVEEEDIMGAIALAERDLQETIDNLEHYRKFVKKGFGTPAALRLREQDVERTRFYLGRDKAKLKVLQYFTLKRKRVELTAKAKESSREWERTKRTQKAQTTKAQNDLEAAGITAGLEKVRLEKLKKQLDRCVVKAPQDGIIVYSKDRYWDPSSRVRVGAMIHFQQTIFSLPDLNKMQVKVKIHESNVKKVKPGQKAEIRIDAYPNAVLRGTVEKVATIADSRGPWDEGGAKEYVTIVKIDDLPAEAGLKPGMTAEVKVFVNQLSDVLIVPVQAVAERENQHYSYTLGPKGFERRSVTLGQNNESFVEIKQGLVAGEHVALDTRARLRTETKSGEPGKGDAPAKKSADSFALQSSGAESKTSP